MTEMLIEVSLSFLKEAQEPIESPAKAGFDWRGETKTQSGFGIEYFKTQVVDLISTMMHLEN